MNLGLEKLLESKVEDIITIEQFSEVVSQLENELFTSQTENTAKENLSELVDVIRQHGWSDPLSDLFGSELSELGIDITNTESIINGLTNYIGEEALITSRTAKLAIAVSLGTTAISLGILPLMIIAFTFTSYMLTLDKRLVKKYFNSNTSPFDKTELDILVNSNVKVRSSTKAESIISTATDIINVLEYVKSMDTSKITKQDIEKLYSIGNVKVSAKGKFESHYKIRVSLKHPNNTLSELGWTADNIVSMWEKTHALYVYLQYFNKIRTPFVKGVKNNKPNEIDVSDKVDDTVTKSDLVTLKQYFKAIQTDIRHILFIFMMLAEQINKVKK